MRCRPDKFCRRGKQRGFTLAEVLAALLFLGIVIPVAIQGLRIASLAGEVGLRKTVAVRIATRVLNELKVTGQLQSSGQNGVVQDKGMSYHWALTTKPWTEDTTTPMIVATVQVTFPAQGKDYDVSLSTLTPSLTAATP